MKGGGVDWVSGGWSCSIRPPYKVLAAAAVCHRTSGRVLCCPVSGSDCPALRNIFDKGARHGATSCWPHLGSGGVGARVRGLPFLPLRFLAVVVVRVGPPEYLCRRCCCSCTHHCRSGFPRGGKPPERGGDATLPARECGGRASEVEIGPGHVGKTLPEAGSPLRRHEPLRRRHLPPIPRA